MSEEDPEGLFDMEEVQDALTDPDRLAELDLVAEGLVEPVDVGVADGETLELDEEEDEEVLL